MIPNPTDQLAKRSSKSTSTRSAMEYGDEEKRILTRTSNGDCHNEWGAFKQ